MIIKRKRKNLNETFSPQNICHVSTHFYKYVIYIMKYTNTQKTPGVILHIDCINLLSFQQITHQKIKKRYFVGYNVMSV